MSMAKGRMSGRFRRVYGAGPLHALLMLGCLALAGYTVLTLGPASLLRSGWNSMLVWFLGSVLLIDLVLLPLAALADRALQSMFRKARDERPRGARTVPSVINYVRVPVLASGLLFLLFFPGIIGQGSGSYQAATGQTQDPFLERWLLLSASMVVLSAAGYVLSIRRVHRRKPARERKR